MPYCKYGTKKEGDAMKKLFALLMALTMTFQLVTPAWADTAEEHTRPNPLRCSLRRPKTGL